MKDKKQWRKKVLTFVLSTLIFTSAFFESSILIKAEGIGQKIVTEERSVNNPPVSEDTYIKVYYLLYDGQEENVFSNFIVQSPCEILKDGTIRSVINPNPEIYDYNANGISLDVDINRGMHCYGQIPITEECNYSKREGYIEIPGKYLGKDLTVTVWQNRDSPFYENLVPDELKPQGDRKGEISFYTFHDNFPTGTIPVLFEPKGCNIVTLSGDIRTIKVGDIWKCSADTWYVADNYNADSYKWEDVEGCKAYDKGFSQGQIVSIKDCENPMFNNIGGAGPEGKNWMFMGCLSSINNTFQGVPVITSMYIECIAKEKKTAMFFVHATCKGPKGQRAQTIGGFFKAKFNVPWIEICKHPTTEKSTWIDGSNFTTPEEWAKWAVLNNPSYDLTGAKYTAWNEETGEYFYDCITTDASGYGWCYLPAGRYQIQESVPPKGYIRDETWYKVDLGGTNYIFHHPEPVKTAEIRIHKSAVEATTQSLAHAKYGVYWSKEDMNRKAPQYIITTDEKGYGQVIDIPLWNYYVKEIEAPDGFELDRKIYTANCTDPGPYADIGVDLYSEEPLQDTKITLQKQSLNLDCTDNNSAYSLKGAEYSIYNNPKCTDYVDKMITDENGYAEKIGLKLGKYYVKETKASKGYTVDKTIYPVDLTTGSGNIEYQIVSKEIPLLEVIDILIKKLDKNTGNPVPQGQGSLEGAEFTFKFYKGEHPENTDPETLGKAVDKTWVFGTDKKGIVKFHEDYKLSGDTFYYDCTNHPALPVGTLVIKETKAPTGYHINEETFIKRITPSGTSQSAQSYVTPEIKEESVSIKIIKIQKGKDVRIPGTVFRHTMPDGTTKDYATDDKGEIQLRGLAVGKHQVVELSPAEGFLPNTSVFEFEVTTDNQVHAITQPTSDSGIFFAEEKNGDGTLTVKNQLAPFKLNIHKVNNKDTVLEDAEFTLYEDKECSIEVDKQVSNQNGDLSFKNIETGRDYYLKETKAPVGYKLPINGDGSPVVYKIKVESDPLKDQLTVYLNDKAYDANSQGSIIIGGTKGTREINMTVVNTVNGKLPNTGSQNMIWLLTIGSILSIIALKKNKKCQNDKQRGENYEK